MNSRDDARPRLTPVELRQVRLRRALTGGYRRRAVDELLNRIADSFEDAWRERAKFSDRVHEVEAEIANHLELERLLRSTLVSAERAAQDMREQARRESDLIVQDAYRESRRIARAALAEKRRLEHDVITIRAQLRAALDMVTDGTSARHEEAEAPPAARAVIDEPAGHSIRTVAG